VTNVLSYRDVQRHLDDVRNKYLLLGNGFSIALRHDIFSYESLYKHANLTEAPHLEGLFEALGTQDFEIVIRQLADAARLISIYRPEETELFQALTADARKLKQILVEAIASRHPDRPYDVSVEQYQRCRTFLAPFGHIYTLNYDVLLYWALMQDEVDDLNIRPDDGFRHPEDNPDEPYVSWQEAHKPTVHYLHGALHLFDTGADIVKYTWSKTDIPIVEQIRASLDAENYPLFVAEGTSLSKRAKIMHNAYLHKALRSFEGCANTSNASMVIYGHSLADNDQHVLRLIERGKVSQLYVSLYGPPDTEANQATISAAERLAVNRSERRKRDLLEVTFFDAESAQIWG